MGSFNSTSNYLTICFCWYEFDTEHKDSQIFSIFCCISRYFTVALGNDWWNKAGATLYINHFQKTKIYQLNFILSVDFNKIWSWSLTKCLTDFRTNSGKPFWNFQFMCSVHFRFLTNIQKKIQVLGPNPKNKAKSLTLGRLYRRPKLLLFCQSPTKCVTAVVQSLQELLNPYPTRVDPCDWYGIQGTNWHIPPCKKENHLQTYLGWGYVPRKVCLPTNST